MPTPKRKTVIKGAVQAVVLAAALVAARATAPKTPVNITGQMQVYKQTGDKLIPIGGKYNLIMGAGWRQLWKLFANTDSVHFDTLSRIQVGSDTTTADTSQAALSFATPAEKRVDSVRAGAVSVRYYATFLSAQGNFPWREIGLFNRDSTKAYATMFDRVNVSLGTKIAADTWVVKVTLSGS